MINATIAFFTIAVLSTGMLQAGEAPRRTDPSTKRPNVLFISIDDLNDWIGALGGHPQAKAPNLDRLIARSVHFSNAHCAAPVCSASLPGSCRIDQPFTDSP